MKVVALITLFQGNVALPLAFLLERLMSDVRMSADNPLKPLSISGHRRNALQDHGL